eukprot:TRINITY_DN84666_c0_g1_i1.p1 TRINITY_DN84666_c0_g1~~TRINITY_DN84666_c0_g1_i1.p1  ORF type:complete len:250 (-),score=68.69 TRINITY_DN84666_c0_g1_i1:66-719(-)
MAGRGGGYTGKPVIECDAEGDDFEDIVDSPYGAEHAAMMAGEGEDEDFTITGDAGSAADAAFDRQVEVLQEVVLDDTFQELLNSFCREHCHHFEDTEENKFVYTELFQKYSELIEGHLEKQLTRALPGFSMAAFLEELSQRGEEEIDSAVFDLLVSLGDFMTFKQQMLEVKGGAQNDLAVAGMASHIHVDEDEEGEARPDLDSLLTVSPATPSKRRS